MEAFSQHIPLNMLMRQTVLMSINKRFKGSFTVFGFSREVIEASSRVAPYIKFLNQAHRAHSPCGCTYDKGGRRGEVGKSCCEYLLFASALMARDWLALLNWALRTLTAALKPPDG